MWHVEFFLKKVPLALVRKELLGVSINMILPIEKGYGIR